MLGFDRKAARYIWTAALVLLLFSLVYLVRKTLFVFIVAVLFAYLLSPLVNVLDRFLPTRTRTFALTLAYVIFVGIVVLMSIQIGSRIIAQAKALEKDLPAKLSAWEHPSPELSPAMNSSFGSRKLKRPVLKLLGIVHSDPVSIQRLVLRRRQRVVSFHRSEQRRFFQLL